MQPREFFPNMPNEVFDDWLAPLIEAKGWRFTSIEDDLQATELRYILGIDSTLKEWCTCDWELKEINLTEIKLTMGSLEMVGAIITHAALGKPSTTSNVENTVERFNNCTRYIKENGNIPKPIILKPEGDGFMLMDGNHRLAALIYLKPSKATKIPAWIPKFT